MTAKEIFYEAMRRTDAGDQDGFLAMFADDCHWVVPGAEFALPGGAARLAHAVLAGLLDVPARHPPGRRRDR